MDQNKLKVMHLVWWGEIGGISLNLIDFITEDKCIDNYICLLSQGGSTSSIMAERSAKYFELKIHSGIDPRGVRRLLCLLNNIKVDVIHMHSPTFYAAIALLFLKRKIRIIFQEHGSLQQQEYRAKRILFYKLFKGIFDRFISISENTKMAMQTIGIPSYKIVILNNPVNSMYFKPEINRNLAKKELGIPEKSLVIGTACRLAPEKDLALFLKTARILSAMQKNALFVIVGGGTQKKQLVKQAELLGIADRTLFIDFRLDMVIVWRAFDVFLFTSISESFGRTLLESLSCETPIAAAMPITGGAIDIIENCPGIINTGGRDERKMAETVQELLISEEKRNQRGRLGRKWVIERYNLKKWVEQMKQIYFSVCD